MKIMGYIIKSLSVIVVLITLHSKVWANTKDSIRSYNVSNVNIIGDKSLLMNSIPGSAVVINNDQIRSMRSIGGNQILRTLTGVNVVDEEGAGLRMNMGIRGLDPDRSRALLVLEDGIPVALAPYGEPELYYTPSIDRMNSIEVLKGSGSIVYGPQTIGGVLNYITNDPPLNSETDFHLTGGNDGFLNTKIGYGSSNGFTGFLTELHYKRADRIGLTRYNIIDYMAKAKFTINKNSSLSTKIGIYNESSNSTYVGITQNMFDNGAYFTEIAPNDELNIRRYSASINYQNVISTSTVFNTSIFAYTTDRSWRRQDFGRTSSVSNKTGVVFGDTSIAGGAIYMRNTTGNRDRAFDVVGIQPNIVTNLNIWGFENEFNIGARFLYENAKEQRINGTNFKSISGNLVEDEDRTGLALSGFIQDRIYLTEKIILSPGLRFENFNYERDIYRVGSKDTSLVAKNTINEIIPGIGINYSLSDRISVFAGSHRGFAPPRTKDAITNEGTALDLSAELSWNYELGIRSNLTDYIYTELTGFMLDFSNQIIPVSESSGNLGFGLINGGSTMHQGLELAVMTDLSRALSLDYSLTWSINSTYSDAKFNSDRFIGSSENKVNIKGNRLPYAPEYQVSTNLQFKMPQSFGVNLNLNYVGQQFTDELNTIKPSNDGTVGLMDAFMLIDVTLLYELNPKSDLFISIKNITDERYIASRRPQGIKVGIPRFITAGIDYHF